MVQYPLYQKPYIVYILLYCTVYCNCTFLHCTKQQYFVPDYYFILYHVLILFNTHLNLAVLCTVYCVLCTVYCVLCTVYCLLFNVYCLLFTVYCLLFTVYCCVSRLISTNCQQIFIKTIYNNHLVQSEVLGFISYPYRQ